MKRSALIIATLTLAITGCTTPQQNTDANSESSASSSEITYEETKNVLYRGTLTEAGVSIFMQGTHKLTLDDGRFIMLESDMINMDHYIGKKVEVFGSVRPTVEEGGQIMNVESITSLEESSSSEISGSGTSMDSSADATISSSSIMAMLISSSAVSSKPTEASSAPAAIASSSPIAWEASGELSAKAEQMAKVKMDTANWSQTYCAKQFNFCVPVHKNWWFNAFGATSSAVWHVEVGPSEIENLGDGPLTVRLLSGDISTTGMSDGQVSVQNDTVVGMKAWTNNRHLEIRAPANLEAAVRFMTEHVVATAG